MTVQVQAQLQELKSWEYDETLEGKSTDYFNAFRSGTVDSDRAALDQFFDQYFFARWTVLEDLGEGQMVSAALALSQRVLQGGEKERDDYFAFLKSGGSRFPIEALKVAGVDMSSPEPVETACKTFAKLVDELEKLI